MSPREPLGLPDRLRDRSKRAQVTYARVLSPSRERDATAADERAVGRPNLVPPNEMEAIMRLATPLLASSGDDSWR